MRTILLVVLAVVLVGCGSADTSASHSGTPNWEAKAKAQANRGPDGEK